MKKKEIYLLLNNLSSISLSKIWQLIHHFGSASKLIDASKKMLSIIPFLNEKNITELIESKNNPQWKKDLHYCEQENIQIISYNDPDYPPLLKKTDLPPLVLYVKGDPSLLSKSGLAIVGTREPSLYAKQATLVITKELSNSFTIISGLARGIDELTHKTTLDAQKKTIAVIPCGLKTLFEERNTQIVKRIQRHGAIVTEYPTNTPVLKHQCIARNRIISGLSRGTLLIQADTKSGSLHTMAFAQQQKRYCFALPGPITDNKFRGNHQLIRNQKATLVHQAEDIFQEMETLFSLTEYPKKNEQ